MCRACFFFQAEDGIRDLYVAGVQTCALPISRERLGGIRVGDREAAHAGARRAGMRCLAVTNSYPAEALAGADLIVRSLEEIGRAACRERGSCCVVAVPVDKDEH